jgi:large subunit ribosomal protein L9
MANQIKVLLKNDVVNLGTGGEVVRVRPGFARNFLLPRGLAVPATAGNLARVEDLKRQVASQAKLELEQANAAAAQIGGVSVTIARAVGEEGKMYGSVTTKDIEDAFAAQGVSSRSAASRSRSSCTAT